MKSNGGKRSKRPRGGGGQRQQHEWEEPITDDLAIAAQFAMTPTRLPVPEKDDDPTKLDDSPNESHPEQQSTVVPRNQEGGGDDNEIALDDDEAIIAEEAEDELSKSDRTSPTTSSVEDGNWTEQNHRLDSQQQPRVDDEEEEKEHEEAPESISTGSNKNNDEDDDDDDSEVDLTHELNQMQPHALFCTEEEEDETSPNRTAVDDNNNNNDNDDVVQCIPKTMHEVDAYHTRNVQTLEALLGTSLSVHEHDCQRLQPPHPGGASPRPSSSKERFSPSLPLVLAGHIHHHLVEERIVIVQSSSSTNNNNTPARPFAARNDNNNDDARVLQEGNLLVWEQPALGHKQEVEQTTTEPTKTKMIPLGKVLEIFGPVSQPMYSIRLPDPPQGCPTEALQNQKNKKTMTNGTTSVNGQSPLEQEQRQEASILSETITQTDHATTDDTNNNSPSVPPQTNKEEVMETTVEGSSSSSLQQEQQELVADRDPWSSQGEYTQWLQKGHHTLMGTTPHNPSTTSRIPVYYLSDEVRLLDTVQVYQQSGRGCDASNLHDEEVLHPYEMEYSDDEQERQARSNRRRRAGASSNSSNHHHQPGPAQPPNHTHHTTENPFQPSSAVPPQQFHTATTRTTGPWVPRHPNPLSYNSHSNQRTPVPPSPWEHQVVAAAASPNPAAHSVAHRTLALHPATVPGFWNAAPTTTTRYQPSTVPTVAAPASDTIYYDNDDDDDDGYV